LFTEDNLDKQVLKDFSHDIITICPSEYEIEKQIEQKKVNDELKRQALLSQEEEEDSVNLEEGDPDESESHHFSNKSNSKTQ